MPLHPPLNIFPFLWAYAYLISPSFDAVRLTTREVHNFCLSKPSPCCPPAAIPPAFLMSERTCSRQAARATPPARNPPLMTPPPPPSIVPRREMLHSHRGSTYRRRRPRIHPPDPPTRSAPSTPSDPTSDVDIEHESDSAIPLGAPADVLIGHPAQDSAGQGFSQCSHADWAREHRAQPLCQATMQHLQQGSPPNFLLEVSATHTLLALRPPNNGTDSPVLFSLSSCAFVYPCS